MAEPDYSAFVHPFWGDEEAVIGCCRLILIVVGCYWLL